MPSNRHLKKRRKCVYYCYKWPPRATSMVYPTWFWWHLDVSNTMLVGFWCIRHFLTPLFALRQLFSWNFWNCAPRLHRKHYSQYSHKAFLIKNISLWTSKRPELILFWWWFSALSLCCSLLSPFIPSMPPKLDLKKRRKYVYHCYRWPPWATLLIYPTAF